MDVLDLADRLWRGEESTSQHHPLNAYEACEVADGVLFVSGFGNCVAVRTGDGLVMVDTGNQVTAQRLHDDVRRWSDARLDTAIYSHGHVDHVFGVGVFEEEAERNRWAPPRVVAHEHVARRFDRYVLTAGYNQVVNRRQFGFATMVWPTTYRYPDEVYALERDLDVGGLGVHLRHEKGETDDATVTWFDSLGVLCTGDLFIWSSPNAGNPQKVQRYPREWAQALRRMADLGARVLLPGHGLPIVGAERIAQALTETAEYLESLVDQTLAMMNEGARLSEVLASVTPPRHLADRPFLQPVYDEPEFIVRNVWRLYGGWWDGNPASLKPAPERRLGAEIAALVGGAGRLATRAEELVAEGGDDALRLAGHLVELAWLAAPEDQGVCAARQRVNAARAAASTSTMARGVFSWAARESAPPS
ncbi:MAG: MBL fold metallo-hydrolase [Acidobacteriota bacterium]|nr:MBL fold metallo-hydrolase [Acidobacteriota bacterium]